MGGGKEREIRWHERVSYPDVCTHIHMRACPYIIHTYIYTHITQLIANKAEELRIFDPRYHFHFEINISPCRSLRLSIFLASTTAFGFFSYLLRGFFFLLIMTAITQLFRRRKMNILTDRSRDRINNSFFHRTEIEKSILHKICNISWYVTQIINLINLGFLELSWN